MDDSELFPTINTFIDKWCDRRDLSCLRRILRVYPMPMGLTDDWGELLNGLEEIRIYESARFSDADKNLLNQLIAKVTRVLRNR